MRPKAIYIMLPLEPGDQIDVGNAGGTHPNGDETSDDDGWAAFSGTSAAAPQLAGAAALIKQACPAMKPSQVVEVLRKTARDVSAGKCNVVPDLHNGLDAMAGPDSATGEGLVDAHKAALLAKVRCLGPAPPAEPISPTGPSLPLMSVESPPTPVFPMRAENQPMAKPLPITPREIPRVPTPAPSSNQARLSSEEMEALEDMILGDVLDLES
jgi:hypothetical protein